eukprot:scaffold56215_cov66-Phaeocystis_antarctica.AAC.4
MSTRGEPITRVKSARKRAAMDPITREIDALSSAAAVLYGVTSAIASLPHELITLIAEKLAKLDAPSLTNFAAASAFCLAASHGQLRATMLAGVQTCLTNFADYVSAPSTKKGPARSTRRALAVPPAAPAAGLLLGNAAAN